MDKSEVVSLLIQIPRKHNDLGSVSVFSLLTDSGYLNSPDEISDLDIVQGLHEHPEYIRDWRDFSEDKRTTGWYLMEPCNGKFGVGYISSADDDEIEPLYYPNETSACAAFIKMEMEYVRAVISQAESRRKNKSGRE